MEIIEAKKELDRIIDRHKYQPDYPLKSRLRIRVELQIKILRHSRTICYRYNKKQLRQILKNHIEFKLEQVKNKRRGLTQAQIRGLDFG